MFGPTFQLLGQLTVMDLELEVFLGSGPGVSCPSWAGLLGLTQNYPW